MLLNPKQMNPNGIREVLRAADLAPASSSKSGLSQLLEDANLTAPEVLMEVGNLMRIGETGQIRLRAAETGLKLNGLLDSDEGSRIPFTVNIVIKDSQFTEINPILIPR
jgi:hypothetical protein